MNIIQIKLASVTLTAFAAFIVVFIADGSVGAQQTQRAFFQVIDCPKDINGGVSVRVDGKRVAAPRDMAVRRDISSFSLPLTPGHHVVSIKGPVCSSDEYVMVLPGHDRHIVSVLSTGRLISNGSSYIAGSVPLKNATPSILCGGETEQPIVFDDGAYYAEHLMPGSCTLRFAIPTTDLQVRIPIVVSALGSIRNISMNDVRRYVGWKFVHGKTGLEFVPMWPK